MATKKTDTNIPAFMSNNSEPAAFCQPAVSRFFRKIGCFDLNIVICRVGVFVQNPDFTHISEETVNGFNYIAVFHGLSRHVFQNGCHRVAFLCIDNHLSTIAGALHFGNAAGLDRSELTVVGQPAIGRFFCKVGVYNVNIVVSGMGVFIQDPDFTGLCQITVDGFNDIAELDQVEAYIMVEVER